MAELATSESVVVLLDHYTCNVAENVMHNALTKHAQTITDIREVCDSHYGSDLVIFEPSCPAIVTREIMEYLISTYAVKPHVIYQTEEIGALFQDIANCVKANYNVIEWNLIYAVLNKDSAILEVYQRTEVATREFADVLGNLPSDYADPVNRMFQSYLHLASSFSKNIERLSRLEELVHNYISVGKKTATAISELQSLLDSATKENHVYCAMLSESYDKVFAGMYTNRPRVLYIRQITHLAGIDLLLITLNVVLTKQYKSACKVVKLVDSSNAVAVRYIPNMYTPLSDSYNTADVLNNDFLVNLGSYNVLMNLLMLNRSGLEVLIVHDCRGTLNDALDASLIDLKLNEVTSDYAQLKESDNILSDCKEADFNWVFSEVSKYTGTDSAKLSAHPTITSILDYLM